MTKGLKDLLQQYGLLSVTLSKLRSERPGNEHASLDAYYESLGGVLPDEPVVLVKVSKDNERHFLEEGGHGVVFKDEEGKKTGTVTVWELPEDEFWFFRAFRPAYFELEKALPSVLYEMGLVHSYAMFEAYLTDILRARLLQHPRLMGGQRQFTYDQIFEASSKSAIIAEMVEREIRELMYLPLLGLLEKMRDKLGFSSLTEEYDEPVNRLSLARNCLLHNGRKADKRLVNCGWKIEHGERLLLGENDVSDAVTVLRKFAHQVDLAFERLHAKGGISCGS
jgi:hypothetical protein